MSALPAAIGRYEVQAFIARGGMGTLYLASDPVLQRQVAIKLLRDADNDELRVRFTREARAAANLRHRNIVTIFDVGEHGGQPFMAMEYVQGQTLTALIDSDPPASIVRRLQLVEDLCDGLSYAHKRGVIHRDIKPANLMLDSEGTLKILDFGIARAAAEAGMTQAGLLLGTLNYMSPEQVAGAEVDKRSDMFAVGAVLYELLTKRQAFPGAIDGGVLNRILNGEPEPLDTLCPHLEPALYDIVRRTLAKVPADRYDDLQQMRAEIVRVRQALETSALADLDQTIVAVPVSDTDGTIARPTRRGTDREELARRRSGQIDAHVAAARQALAAGAPDEAIACCEQALMLDPDDPRAFDLAERARLERDQAHAHDLMRQARDSLKTGDLTLASSRVREALALMPESADALEIGRVIGEARVVRERERQRAADIQALCARAAGALEAGEPEAALAACNEALTKAPAHEAARQLRDRAQGVMAARARAARERQAQQTATEARQLFAAGHHADALALLESVAPAHPVVSQAWTELSAQAARLAREREAGAGSGSAAATDTPLDATVFARRGPEPADGATVFAPRDGRGDAHPAQDARPDSSVTGERRAQVARVPFPRAPAAPPPGRVQDPPVGASPDGSASHRPARQPAAPSRAPASAGSRSRLYTIAAAALVVLLLTVGYIVFRTDSPTPPDTMAAAGAVPVAPEDRPIGPGVPLGTPAPADDESATANPNDRLDDAEGRRPSTSAPSPSTSGEPAETAPPERSPSTSGASTQPVRPEPPVPAPTPAPEPTQEPPPPVTPAAAPPDASAAVEEIVPPAGPPPAAPSASQPESTVAETIRPADPIPDAPREPPPPPPPAVTERPRIEAALAAYAAAYSNLDADAVARIYPSVDIGALRRAFGDARALDLQVDIQMVKVSGDTAVVSATVRQRFQGSVGAAQSSSTKAEFLMEKSGGTWLIATRK